MLLYYSLKLMSFEFPGKQSRSSGNNKKKNDRENMLHVVYYMYLVKTVSIFTGRFFFFFKKKSLFFFLKKWHFDLIFMDNIVKWQKTLFPLYQFVIVKKVRKKRRFFHFDRRRWFYVCRRDRWHRPLPPPPLIAGVTSAVNFHILRDTNKNRRENIWK